MLWTPGHAPGHICLYEPVEKVLICGDHILPGITPNIGLHPHSSGNPLGDYLNSLDELSRLEIKLALPGHEEPFTNVKTRIAELIQHHQDRNTEILATIKTEAKSAYQVAREITWMADLGGVPWQELHSWDRRLAVMETLAHLEAMKIEGKIDKSSGDSVIYYQQA